jgi:GAF domain-containing protein
MTYYPIPANETDRLKALESYNVVSDSAKEGFVRLVRLALATCDVPIAFISLVNSDRTRFIAKTGINTDEIPREKSLCQYAIMNRFLLFVEDAAKDERFSDKLHVAGSPQIRFYAGQPLIDKDGYILGCFSIADHVPRQINEKQKEILKILADEAFAQIAFLREQREQLKVREQFLENTSH